MLVSTHYMDEAEYCNRVALITRGRLIALGTPHELRGRSLGGELLTIEREGIVNAIDLVEKAPGVHDVAVFGSALHVLVDDAAMRAPALVAYLTGHGIAGASARRIDPTMEDSFVHLVGAAAQARGDPA